MDCVAFSCLLGIDGGSQGIRMWVEVRSRWARFIRAYSCEGRRGVDTASQMDVTVKTPARDFVLLS